MFASHPDMSRQLVALALVFCACVRAREPGAQAPTCTALAGASASPAGVADVVALANARRAQRPHPLTVTITQAFASDVIRPRDEEVLSVPYIEGEAAACDEAAEPDRCAMLHAVFAHGEMSPQTFSPDARTIYGN